MFFARKQNYASEIEKELDAAFGSLENIDAIKRMRDDDGWKLIETQILKDMSSRVERIYGMSADPRKHEMQLIINYAIAETGRRIVGLVNGTINREPQIREEITRLRERVLHDDNYGTD